MYSQPHRGTLVLGILGLVCCPFGPVAWIMANGDLKQMDAGTMDASGRSMTNGGKICGIIGTVFFPLGILLGVGLFMYMLFWWELPW